MFAVVKIAGKQYTVKPDDTLDVDHIAGDVGSTLTFSDVLLVRDGKLTNIGTPLVPKAVVSAKILAQKKGQKLDVRRFKNKVRHRRHIGFRPQLTTIQVISIA